MSYQNDKSFLNWNRSTEFSNEYKKSNNYEILRTLENKDSTSCTIVNSILFPVNNIFFNNLG